MSGIVFVFGQAIKRRLGRAIKASLAADRRRRAYEVGAEVEALVGSDPLLIKEAWHRIQGWYKAAADRAPPPARVTLEQIMVERVALYSYVPPPGKNIPVHIETFLVDDSVPEEGDIEWAVKSLRNNRSGGLSRMREEHVKRWLAAARKSEKERVTAGGKKTTTATKTGGPEDRAAQEGAENWTRVVDLIQAAFQDGKLPEEATWQAVVLIPKGKKEYWGIGLVEVMWKVVAEILNRRFTASITYHDFLHGFWAGCGTGTATLNANLFQQLAALREEVL